MGNPRLASDFLKELHLEMLKEGSKISLLRPSSRVNLLKYQFRLSSILFASLYPTPSRRPWKDAMGTEEVGTPKRFDVSRNSRHESSRWN
jgi:hypothetical protein